MRVIASGDLHWDEHRRWAECVRVHGWLVELVRERRPDLFLCPGDVYERASTPKERAGVADFFTAIAEVCPVIVIKGNHDKHLDCQLLSRLRSTHPIYVEESASVQFVAGAAIACVAWPERATLLAWAAARGLLVEVAERQALQALLRGLGERLAAHDGPRILAGHFMVDGSETSHGQPLIGHALNVGLSDLGLVGADITLMSHIHKGQEWIWNGAPIVYCGSPYRTAYGELEPKSVVVAEFGQDGRLASWERVLTPCAGMVLIDEEWASDGRESGWLRTHGPDLDLPPWNGVAGAEVRFRYIVDAEHREAARAAAEQARADLLRLGAVDVKLEAQVRAVSTARAPEVAYAITLVEKLRAMWAARGETPARQPQIELKVVELEGRHAA